MSTESRPTPLNDWPGVLSLEVASTTLALTQSRTESGLYLARCPLHQETHVLRVKLLPGGLCDCFCTATDGSHTLWDLTTYLQQQCIQQELGEQDQ